MPCDEYTPRDPTLASWDHGVAELRVNGELRAYLVCVVGRIGLRDPGQPWPWFVVVWPDGQKDPAQEDYGPGWLTVRELDGGTFTNRRSAQSVIFRARGFTSVDHPFIPIPLARAHMRY